MRLHGWQIRFPNSPAIAQITLSSSKFCLSLIVDCFCTSWNETSLQSFNLLTPNVNYSGRTAPLTSKVAFYIFIQQIRGLLEKYPTFGREKETGLLGALDT